MGLIREVGKGILIGVANIVPGVSGGALAIAMGIYDKIIGAITHILREPKKSAMVLLPYMAGAAVGVAGLSLFIEYLLENYLLPTSLAFVGLIVGAAPSMIGRLRQRECGFRGCALTAAVFGVLVFTAVNGGAEGRDAVLTGGAISTAMLVIVGLIGAATIIIPGVSGTMILMMMGYYQPLLSSINRFMVSAATLQLKDAWAECRILAPFGLGMAAGIFLCAKLVEFLLERYETLTYCAILGLVLSSPFVILKGIPMAGAGPAQWVMGGGIFVLSVMFVMSLEHREIG